MSRCYAIGELARLSGVTVRTLRHYDHIGLLVPQRRDRNGYRVYVRAQLERLHQILLWRALDFSLEDVARLLDDPSWDRQQALRTQREALLERIEADRALLRTIDALLKEDPVSDRDLFGGFDPAQYDHEAQARWGRSEAFQESRRRAKRWSEDDKRRMMAETQAPYRSLAELRDQGLPPDSEPARQAAEAHRRSIEAWFYPCPPERHLGLADLYEADERFQATIDGFGEGLTAYVVAAIRANARA